MAPKRAIFQIKLRILKSNQVVVMQSHGLVVDLYCVLVILILLNIFHYMHCLMEE